MSKFPEKLRLEERADEDRFFARRDAALKDLLKRRRVVWAGELKVVSGGQTGVDRAALDAALAAGIAAGGWCPAGRRAEDGVIPSRYPLLETPSADYAERTERNVRDSDATLVLYLRCLRGGSRLTADLARRLGKPVMCKDLSDDIDIASIVRWLELNKVRIINCAGPRESELPGVRAEACELLAVLLEAWKLVGCRSWNESTPGV